MTDINSVDKVLNAKFIFSNTLKSIIIRTQRASHPSVTNPLPVEHVQVVDNDIDPPNKGPQRISA